jgi:hypothetical protein
LPDRFKISQLTAGLPWALYRATGELHRRHAARTNGRRNPGQLTVAVTSRIRRRISGPKYT